MFKTMLKLYYMQLLYDYLKGIKTLFKMLSFYVYVSQV